MLLVLKMCNSRTLLIDIEICLFYFYSKLHKGAFYLDLGRPGVRWQGSAKEDLLYISYIEQRRKTVDEGGGGQFVGQKSRMSFMEGP